MKINSKVVIATLFLFIAVSVHAETTYVPVKQTVTKFQGVRKDSSDGNYGAELLSGWEKNNPDKKIVSVTVHSNTHGLFYGFWITWEPRAK